MSPSGGTSYRAVLSVPCARRLFLTAALGRLAYAILPLGLLLSVAQATSFTTAGLVAAATGATIVLAGPWRAGLVDRYGRRALIPLMLGYVAGNVVLLIALRWEAPVVALVAIGALTGASPPPLGPSMRVMWSRLVDREDVQRAYALDAVTEEVLFTTGPLVTGVLVGVFSPQSAVLAGVCVLAVGTVAFVSSPGPGAATGEAAGSAEQGPPESPLRAAGFVRALVMLAGVSSAMSLVYVGVPVIATQAGHPAVAGPLEAAIAAGSAVGGLLYGRRAWRRPLGYRLNVVCLALAAVVAGLAAAGGTWWLLVPGLFAAGMCLSPALIIAYSIGDTVVAPAARTRASIWVNTAGNAGGTAGAMLAGVLADRLPAQALFLIAGIVLAGVVAAAGRSAHRGTQKELAGAAGR
ncbi:MFS transporter [Longispora albida]|uniref:MFS transporter n=1 Tax=Longispora albida TaxID=203523 RepID=UPI000382A323|nr:MFS transporter [Longispora albida]